MDIFISKEKQIVWGGYTITDNMFLIRDVFYIIVEFIIYAFGYFTD